MMADNERDEPMDEVENVAVDALRYGLNNAHIADPPQVYRDARRLLII